MSAETLNETNMSPLERLLIDGEVTIDAMTNEEIIAAEGEVAALAQDAKEAKAVLDAALRRRFTDVVDAQFRLAGKAFGSVAVDVGGLMLTAERKKTVTWDNTKLARIASEIRASNGDVSEFIDTKYSIPETKWNSWTSETRVWFEDARTVKISPPTISIAKK